MQMKAKNIMINKSKPIIFNEPNYRVLAYNVINEHPDKQVQMAKQLFEQVYKLGIEKGKKSRSKK